MKKQLLTLIALGSLTFALPVQAETKNHKALRITSGAFKMSAAVAAEVIALGWLISPHDILSKLTIATANSGIALILTQSAIRDFKG